jgi:hypothetical protein
MHSSLRPGSREGRPALEAVLAACASHAAIHASAVTLVTRSPIGGARVLLRQVVRGSSQPRSGRITR